MQQDLTIIIPVRNEHESIGHVVSDINDVMYRHQISYNLVIVDDTSTPPLTREYLHSLCFHLPVRLYHNILDAGLAEALKTGITYAAGKYVIFMSGDGTDDPRALPLYYKRLCAGYDCVFSQRQWSAESWVYYPLLKWIFSRLGNRLISLLFDWCYSDYTDMFKGYRLDIAHLGFNCKAKGFSFPMELCLKAILSGARYAILPTTPRCRIAGTTKFRLWHEAPDYLITLWRCLKLKYRGKNII